MSLAGIALSALGAIVVLLVVVEVTAWVANRKSFVATVILGEDNRTSTSKTFILMWTLLVAWALAALLIAGEFLHTHACVTAKDLASAAQMCKATKPPDEVGLLQIGWMHFLHAGLSANYLVLLAIPGGAGLAAKGITQSKTQGTGFKTTKLPGSGNRLQRITEIFNADDGTTDLGDFQYLIFNLITGVYFVTQFLNPDGSGLPTIPDTLLGLTGVSAGLYVGKKAVTNAQPTITGVFPLPLHDNQSFTVIGTSLTADPDSPSDVDPWITIDGVPAVAVAKSGNRLVAKAPPNLGAGSTPMTRQLQVLNPYGGISANFPVPYL